MFSKTEILDVVEIIAFGVFLPPTIYVCTKHGFKREGGWLLLTIISIIRIVGAACGIAGTKKQDVSLIATSLVMGSIGSATLVAAYTGITNRIADGAKGSPLSPRQRKLLQTLGLISIILGIVGGTKLADSDPDTRSTGQMYLKVAVVFILVQYLATSWILSYSAINIRHIMDADRKLFFCIAIGAPFLAVRTIYSVVAAFDPNSSTFSMLSNSTTALVVRAVVGIGMEVIVVSLFTLGGILAPKLAKGQKVVEEEAFLEGQNASKPQYMAQDTRY